MRKHLSAPGLLNATRQCFSQLADPLASNTKFPLSDCLMSALAMFGLKYPSLLQFDNSQDDQKVRHNLKALYGVEQAPSDTYMRERLDKIDPQALTPAFKACFNEVQRGKMLPAFHFLDDYLLVSNDGTGVFHSTNVHCENCCEKHHRDGHISYYHQIMVAVVVHPSQNVVLPLGLEPIRKQDGHTKNDCERNASKRLLETMRQMHPKLKIVIVEDALHSNAPHIELLQSLNYRYIIGVKPKDHKWLFDWVEAAKCKTYTCQYHGVTYEFRWVNGAPLNESNEHIKVNFLECVETNAKGKQQKFTWVTDFYITEDTVFQLMKGGRARWKVENETFNTLKNQGYHFEHSPCLFNGVGIFNRPNSAIMLSTVSGSIEKMSTQDTIMGYITQLVFNIFN